MSATAAGHAEAGRAADQRRAGVLFALGCFGIWGFAALYFRQLDGVPPLEILLHRSAWSVIFLLPIVLWSGRLGSIRRALVTRRAWLTLLLSATLLAVNWLIFIYAVEVDRVLECSLGYYINPLMSVALGVLALGERLGRLQLLAIGLAAAGVLVLALEGDGFPWIALSLAATFAFYGLLRKTMALGSADGLLAETLLLLPVMLGGMLWLALSGEARFAGGELRVDLLLAASGIVTAVPLLLFASAARRLKLSSIGMFQYIGPTVQFFLAVFLFGEPFTAAYAITFALIWLAVALFLVESWRQTRAAKA
ncbi:MAG TPA: EamA family transporter RarD [Kiloniellales bacterium]|nr:EamA family transporter RarD [Kiloniellales bacterium]